MIELLSLIGGGLLRLLPSVISFFSKKQDLAHELAMMDKTAELEKLRAQNREVELAQMTQQAIDTRWADGIVEALRSQTQVTGDKWLDRVNVSVRPILTYWWCVILYTASKVAILVSAVQANTPLAQFAPLILADFDQSVVGSIIGFWFVDRALRKGDSK